MQPSVIIYYADPLPGGRAQLMRDVLVDGEFVPELTGRVGSPAPAASVAAECRRIVMSTTPSSTPKEQ